MMRGKLKFLLVLPTLWFAFGVSHANDACACTGFGYTLDELIDNSPIIAKVEVVQTDDVAQNGIIRVESYLKGGPGPEYLVLTQTHPAVIAGLVRHVLGGGDCNWLRASLVPGETMYLFLRHNEWGSYSLASSIFNADHYPFPTPDSAIGFDQVRGQGSSAEFYWVELTESEFAQYVVERTGQRSVEPAKDSFYPYIAPLKITTSTGTPYLLPMDGQPPVELTEELYMDVQHGGELTYRYDDILRNIDCDVRTCLISSPDHLFAAAVRPETGAILMSFNYPMSFSGQAFLFSSTSDAVVTWDDETLTAYNYSSGWKRLGSITLSYSSDSEREWLAGRAAWTPDGRLLAFSDANGLWLWNIYMPATEPRLLIPAGEYVLYARYFSPRGRYLAFTEGDETWTLDIIMGTRLPDGRVSLDESRLLAFNTTAKQSHYADCSLTPYECPEQPGGWLREAQWIHIANPSWPSRANSFLVVTCNVDNPESCSVFDWLGIVFDRPVEGYAFAYEPVGKTLAIVTSPTTIRIGDTEIDMAEWLDGDIVSIEWMRSEFYVEP